jgi:subtilisin family serine protease
MRRLALLGLVTIAGVAVPAASALASAGTGRLLVLLSSPTQARAVAAGAGPRAYSTAVRPAGVSVPEIGLVAVRPVPGRSLAATATALRGLPGVREVEPETRAHLRSLPNDPALSAPEPSPDVPSGTPLQWAPAREMFPVAWNLEHALHVRVGVIDTGIDGAHPDFAKKIAFATIPRGDQSMPPATSDQDGHGTHVASLACAGTDNGVGLAGAGYGCRLVSEKVDFSEASIAAAIVDATRHGVGALNMSFGFDPGGRHFALERAIDYAAHRGVVLVAAANDDAAPGVTPQTDQGAPADLLQPAGTGPNIRSGRGLVVTATDFEDHRANFAGSGSEISLAAYGTYHPGQGALDLGRKGPPGLFGAFPTNHTTMDDGLGCSCRKTFHGQSYAYLEGTSMSAPQVAGAAALVRALNPDLGAGTVLHVLKETARRSGGWSADLGWGILDAGRAVGLARHIDRHPPSSRLTLGGEPSGRTVLLRWSGSDHGPPGVAVSGVEHFDVFVKRDHGHPHVIARTRSHSMNVRLRFARGSRYAFFTEAVDRAHNRESAPRHADAVVRGPVGG